MNARHGILIALESVGVDLRGHDHPTWVFGTGAVGAATKLTRPERIFDRVLDWTGAGAVNELGAS